MQTHFYLIDWVVLLAYFAGIMALGFSFWRRSGASTEEFTAGGRSLPGWLCGLSIFATYLSSISYLALPGKSFVANWNPFVFSLALPLAAAVAVVFFLPYYRSTREVSAYAMLEHRFGAWARIYASTFYLLFQIARMGVVMYLMALPMSVIFGWDIRIVILCTGVAVTLYSFVGGIVAVIWADAIQALVLMAGAVFALIAILSGLPEGPAQVFEIGSVAEENKFSLGSFSLVDYSTATFWVVLTYGFFENIKNFGVDQSYVQRYIAAGDDREAAKSVWLGGVLYVPVSALFFFIGSALFAFYQTHPEDLNEVREIVARQQLMQDGVVPPDGVGLNRKSLTAGSISEGVQSEAVSGQQADDYHRQLQASAAELSDSQIGDRVFPHFIAKHLPAGVTGLLVAAVFAAAMSTVSTSINSSATLIMSDFYGRFVNTQASDRQLMRSLHLSTVTWGVLGTVMALLLVRLTESALDVWWTLSSVLGGGIVGLFLLGMISKKADSRSAVIAVVCGMIVIGWMVLSKTDYWPEQWHPWATPFHAFLVIVIGTLTILGAGMLAAAILPRRPRVTQT